MTRPWTQEGRNLAIQKEVKVIYDDYFARGPRWVAKHLPQRKEMSQWRGKISQESRMMILGFLGVESFIEDYAKWAILASGDSLATQGIYHNWVYDERRHPEALRYALIDSRLYTQAEVDEYIHECNQDEWTFQKQTGYAPTPIRGGSYAWRQERQTKNAYHALGERVRTEYGRPIDERGRPLYPAVAGVLRVVGTDEGWHEGVFKRIALVYLRYWPDKALEAAAEVDERYRMPIVNMPDVMLFYDTVVATGVDTPRKVIANVRRPVCEAMGLESTGALRRAARLSQDLPEGAVIQVGDSPDPSWSDGVVPYRMTPDGGFVPVKEETA